MRELADLKMKWKMERKLHSIGSNNMSRSTYLPHGCATQLEKKGYLPLTSPLWSKDDET